MFVALISLTEVLDDFLQYIYHVDRTKTGSATGLDLVLNGWVDSLSGDTRHIVIRGTHLHIHGAANLRLSYLAIRLLVQRIQFETDRQHLDSADERLLNRYHETRRTSEDIVMLTQELQPLHLGDFWLSISAFCYPATIGFLLRCALETNSSPASIIQDRSFIIARDLLSTLRTHQEKHDWDLGDLSLAQHSDIVEKILHGASTEDQHPSGNPENLQDFVPDASILDQFFPSLWDPLQGVW